MMVSSVAPFVGETNTGERVNRVSVIVDIDKADAERLAQHMIDRGDGTLLAAEAKEVATPIVQALIDAGYGVHP
jgi:hypothetical protein